MDLKCLQRSLYFKNKRNNSNRFPYEVSKDGVKWLMLPSKIILEILGVWPDYQNKLSAFINVFCIISLSYLILAQVYYIFDDETDIKSAADAITAVITTAEAIARQVLIIILGKKLSSILSVIYYEFWPSDVAGKSLHCKLNRGSLMLLGAMTYQSFSAFSWAFQCAILQLPSHKLPLSTMFNFPFMKSPYYEILYIWQSVMCFDIVASICALDFFLLSIIWNCVAQFRLLRMFMLNSFEQAVKRSDKNEENSVFDLTVLCYLRHMKLISTCQEIESMLTLYILLLFMGTVGTVCLSGFQLAVVKQQVGKAIPYFFGHLCQIFLYCFLGNELILESTKFSEAVFHCGWHFFPSKGYLWNSQILIMLRAQRPVKITVGGFGVLNLESYVKLLRFCFSVYTLLSTVVERDENKLL